MGTPSLSGQPFPVPDHLSRKKFHLIPEGVQVPKSTWHSPEPRHALPCCQGSRQAELCRFSQPTRTPQFTGTQNRSSQNLLPAQQNNTNPKSLTAPEHDRLISSKTQASHLIALSSIYNRAKQTQGGSICLPVPPRAAATSPGPECPPGCQGHLCPGAEPAKAGAHAPKPLFSIFHPQTRLPGSGDLHLPARSLGSRLHSLLTFYWCRKKKLIFNLIYSCNMECLFGNAPA